MPAQSKIEKVAEIKEKLSGASTVILADYRGLNVKDMQDLRRRMSENDCEVTVYKNRLTKIAVKELEMDYEEEHLIGPTAFALGYGDPVQLAKLVMDFAKEHTTLEVKAAYVDDELVEAATVKALAALPSREELLAKLLGSLQNPVAGFVRVIDGPISAFARTLGAITEQKTAAEAA
jgi:large subunit ribosomal protein L10